MQCGMKYHIEWEEVNLEILFRVNCLKQYLKIRGSITERKPDIRRIVHFCVDCHFIERK